MSTDIWEEGRKFQAEERKRRERLTPEQREDEDREHRRAIAVELQRIYAERAQGTATPSDAAPKASKSKPMPPPGLSAEQRLRWANEHCVPRRHDDQDVSLADLGLSPAEYAKLSPQRKLALANELIEKRRGGR